MTFSAIAMQRPPHFRIAAYYLTMFTIPGIFTALGGIWFSEQGISESGIGTLSAVPVAILLVLNLWIGRLADRASDWRQAIVTLSTLAAVGSLGLLVGTGFWPILFAWSLTTVAQGLAVPVTDAAAIRLSRREGLDYSALRAWGTVGFIGAVFATGGLVALFGTDVFVPTIIGFAILRALMSLALPRFRAAPGTDAQTGARALREVLRPWFVLPLVGWAMVFGTIFLLNTFQALLWERQGLSSGWITFLIALGPAAETAMFFGFRRVAKRFRARHLILVSALVSVFRWCCFALSPDVYWLIPLQLLHAVSYAMGFMGCVSFIANWTSEDIAAEAQSFFVVLQQLACVATLTGFGWLAGQYGAHAYFASALFALAGAGLIALSLKLQEAPPPA